MKKSNFHNFGYCNETMKMCGFVFCVLEFVWNLAFGIWNLRRQQFISYSRLLTLSATTIFCSVITPWRSHAQEQQVVQTNQAGIEAAEVAFLRTLQLLPQDRIPAEYQALVEQVSPPTCATIQLHTARQLMPYMSPDQQQLLTFLFTRPSLPLDHISDSGFFKIHYTTTGVDAVPPGDQNQNGVPDFVDSVATAYDHSYNVEVTQLGYREPPPDDGVDGPEFDIYMEDLGRGFYGWTNSETKLGDSNRWTSYIQMDNDFDNGHYTSGIDAALVTAAHEFFHMIHFGYRAFTTSNEPFYYELCSTWMEEVVHDDINDYYQYLPSYFSRRNVPFDAFENSNYGLGIWNMFLMKNLRDKQGSSALIRRTWEIMAENTSAMDAIGQGLNEIGENYEEQFAEFAVWNYFTGDRADPVLYYDEGAAYPQVPYEIELDMDKQVAVSDSNKTLTYKYYKFSVQFDGNYEISIDAESPQHWKFASIATLSGNSNSQYQIFAPSGGHGLGFLEAGSELIIVASNNMQSSAAIRDRPSLQFRFEIAQVEKLEAYPNPYVISLHEQITFRFTSNDPALAINIMSSEGIVVKDVRLSDGLDEFTPDSYTWDGLDNSGNPVSSGIYIILLNKGGKIQKQKFALIR